MGGVETSNTPPDRIRLHITPFNAELYDRIIPPSLQPLATDRSFHTIQTFPDKGYGFVELPAMEAQKLRKKLNGSTLKGTKMSVEEARPAKKRKLDVEVDGEESERKKAKREKKERRKREDRVLAGHEMEEGRRVKRGWTGDDSREKKDKKEKKERKGKTPDATEDRKLRFKTKVPPNKAPFESEKEKKKKDKKAKKSGEKGQVVVEEFMKWRKSKHGAPLADGAVAGSTSYAEGKGWVDEAGNVVEPERKSKRRKKQPSASPEAPPPAVADFTVAGAENGQSNGPTEEIGQAVEQPQSSEPADSSGESEDESEDDNELPSDTPPTQPAEVHPLEALFKRPLPPTDSAKASANNTPSRPRPAPIDTSFSFFGAGDAGANEDVGMEDGDGDGDGVRAAMPPVTPHTKQDLEWRSLRSAAPTPDTAAIGRKFSFPFANHSLEEDEEDEDGEDEEMAEDTNEPAKVEMGEVQGAGGEGRGEESTFRKWFFENRGDLNRGWKKRRREERKVKRQRENRRLGRKVA